MDRPPQLTRKSKTWRRGFNWDALRCEKESMQMVVENGGDFLFQLMKNAPTAFERASCFDAEAPPFRERTTPVRKSPTSTATSPSCEEPSSRSMPA